MTAAPARGTVGGSSLIDEIALATGNYAGHGPTSTAVLDPDGCRRTDHIGLLDALISRFVHATSSLLNTPCRPECRQVSRRRTAG